MTSLPKLPPRDADSHKGDFGRALLVGGSIGMTGAVSLSGMATLRSGAGLVKLAVPEPCLSIVASFEPSYMTVPLAADDQGRLVAAAGPLIATLAEEATAVAIGPGLGRSSDLVELVSWLYSTVKCPLIVDADGLNALSQRREVLASPGGRRILTPHPGEFGRLVPAAKNVEREAMETAASELARDAGIVVVLKGHRTLVTDGKSSHHNTTGNPGMATGGTGDVLTGIVLGLLCQGLVPLDAARLGVHLHGLAGDLAAAELGQVSMIASDLLRFLPAAMRQL